MKIIHTLREMTEYRKTMKDIGPGFVPTMGALHEGHLSLMEKARNENRFWGVSIFLNPTQFNDPKDLIAYPKTWDNDLKLLEEVGADFLFAPDYNEIYPDNYHYILSENELSKELCGAARPGHFDGVLTIVMKLFQIVQPEKAYFGEKDFQQLTLIEGMVRAFFLPIEIIRCPIIREESGLAMSSRNERLSPEARIKAAEFHKILFSDRKTEEMKPVLESLGFQVDYLSVRDGRIYGAVFLEGIRLIDNGLLYGNKQEVII